MRPQLQPILESNLAAILMGELLRPREDLDDTYVDIVLDDLDLDDDEYASYELVHGPAPVTFATMFAAPTTRFVRVRDTSHDHIETKEYPREALDADTLQTPKYSAPYELIDVEHAPIVVTVPPVIPVVPVVPPVVAQFTSYPHAQFPLNSAPYEKVDLQDYSHAFVKAAPGDWSAAESTEVLSPPQTASRVIATIVVLFGALLLGLSVAVYAMRT